MKRIRIQDAFIFSCSILFEVQRPNALAQVLPTEWHPLQSQEFDWDLAEEMVPGIVFDEEAASQSGETADEPGKILGSTSAARELPDNRRQIFAHLRTGSLPEPPPVDQHHPVREEDDSVLWLGAESLRDIATHTFGAAVDTLCWGVPDVVAGLSRLFQWMSTQDAPQPVASNISISTSLPGTEFALIQRKVKHYLRRGGLRSVEEDGQFFLGLPKHFWLIAFNIGVIGAWLGCALGVLNFSKDPPTKSWDQIEQEHHVNAEVDRIALDYNLVCEQRLQQQGDEHLNTTFTFA